jgi:hypothetical protein
MKLRLFILILSFFPTYKLTGQEKYNVSWTYSGLTFEEFVAKTETLLPVKFYYKPGWVADLKLMDYPGCKTLPCVLDRLFSGKQIHYYIDDFGNIVLTGTFKVMEMNEYLEEDVVSDQQVAFADSVGQDGNQEPEHRKVGNPADRNKPGKVVVSGYIVNEETNEPVAGANVFVQKSSVGAMANESGYFELILPRGFHHIQASFIGMTERKIDLEVYGSGKLNFKMKPGTIALEEVIVTKNKNNVLDRFEVGVENINMNTFKSLPTSLGEPDIMKSLILIPGVKSVGEGAAGFNVRGGSADQNLILFNNAPIYNASHFFGFFSSVNSDIISNVTFYKGGIPGRYGGRISSVLDIESKAGNKKEFAGTAGISPVTTRVMIEGPIIKDTLTYIFSGRTTYTNWIFGLLDDPDLQNSKASFYDLNGSITYYPNSNNTLDISSYNSFDSFGMNSITDYKYTNNIYTFKWIHTFSKKLFSVLSFNNSFYKYDVRNMEIATEAYSLQHKINSSGLKVNFNLTSGKNIINYGLDLNWYELSPKSLSPANDSSMIIYNETEHERALEGAVYIDNKIFLTDFLYLNVGVRMSSFFSFGPKTVYDYDAGFSKSNATIVDTLAFSYGNVVARYGGPEFRGSLNFKVSDNQSVKLNYNRTRQYIHLLSNTTSISPTDTWKLCDSHLKPEIGDQYAVGFYKLMFRKRVETSAEVYYKAIRNMVDYKGGTALTTTDHIEQTMINARGKAYGVELSLKKTEGRVQYSLGYTYSRTFLKSVSNFREETINAGNWYPANYDRPNDLTVTFQYNYSRRLSFNAGYTYSTGRPITYPIATYRINDILLVQYSDRNKYRIPDNSRLDISFRINGNLRTNKIAHPNLTFSVYNLLGRENPYTVYFKKEDQVFMGYLLSVFGRPIPTVTFNFDF